LTVATMSEIRPRDLAQASSLSTVGRAVSSSLGIAILATLVQTQTAVHYGHLVEQVTANSPLGRVIPFIQAYYVAHGASTASAYQAAIQLISLFVKEEAFVLALQDAFRVTIFVIVIALIATLFVRSTRRQAKPASIPPQQYQAPAAQPEEAEHFVAVEV